MPPMASPDAARRKTRTADPLQAPTRLCSSMQDGTIRHNPARKMHTKAIDSHSPSARLVFLRCFVRAASHV